MNTLKPLLFTACVAMLALAGCAEQQQFEPIEKICLPQTDRTEAMLAAEDVLSQMRFTIDKSDAERGLIRTRPLPGAQFFEFWRSDNVGGHNFAEANLHSIRRIAELNISQQGAQLCIGCDVKTQRLSLPQHQISSSSRAYEMFSASGSSMQELKLHDEQKQGAAWVDLGMDIRLGTEILKRIEKQIAKQ